MRKIPNGTRVEVSFPTPENDEDGLPVYAAGTFPGWVVTYAPDLGGYVVCLEPSGEQWVAPASDVKVTT